MLTVDQARRLVLQHSRPKSSVPMAVANSLGLVLAEEIASDIDSPPFDKSMVDGYALRSDDLKNGHGELEVIEEIIAGATSRKAGAPGQCWRIMTGAPIPAGADAVVMHEHTQFIEPGAPTEAPKKLAPELPFDASFSENFADGEFALDTFREMLAQIKRSGGMRKVMETVVGVGGMLEFSELMKIMEGGDADAELSRCFNMIDVMTPDERRNPKAVVDPVRIDEIAAGAGVDPKDVADLVAKFDGIARLMKQMDRRGERDQARKMAKLDQLVRGKPAKKVVGSGPAFGRLGRVRIKEERFRIGQNIMRQGTSLRRSDIVLSPGRQIRPVEIGLLAEVGRSKVSVIEPPTVAVLSTGNELVPPDCVPTAGQIRNSNGPMLTAAVLAAGARPVELGTSRDEPDALRNALAIGLRSDVLIVSGGVSAGALDLVPGLLKELGVIEVFHKISLKPGKPIWFGVLNASSLAPGPWPLAPALAFGLPGNPVSSLVCFELFVRPAIDRLSGRYVPEELQSTAARLTAAFIHRGDRPTFHPSILSTGRDGSIVTLLPWSGAADLRSLSAANALAIFPAGDRDYTAGETIESLPLRP